MRNRSGSLGSGRTAGYAIGEDRTSPWLEAIAGIREQPYPRLGSKPVPAPRTRPEVWCGLRHGFSPAVPATHWVRDMSPSGFHRRDRLKHPPSRAPEKVVGVNPFQAVVRVNPFRTCVRGNPVCGAIQCAGKMCGAVLKLVALSVGRSTL